MVADPLREGSRVLPEKRSFVTIANPVLQRISMRRKAVAGAVGVVAAGVMLFLAIGFVRYERLAVNQQQALWRSERANADLQDEVARLQDRLGSTRHALGTAQTRLTALSDEAKARSQQRNEIERQLAVTEQVASSKADRAAHLTRTLEQAQRDMRLVEAQRATFVARLSKAEADLAEERGRQSQAQTALDQSQKKMQQLTVDHDKIVGERDRLRARVSELERRLAALPQSPRPLAEATPAAIAPAAPAAVSARVASAPPAAAPVVTAAPAPPQAVAAPVATVAAAPAAPAQAVATAATAVAPRPVAVPAPEPTHVTQVAAAARVGRSGIGEFERVLGSAGVDVARLFWQYGVRTGEGGPFVPAPRGTVQPDSLSPEKLAALRNMVKALPVAAPLESFAIGSRFGVRGDPVNGRASYHTGTDFSAPYMSPVYATAAGVVTYSGYRDDYGKIVEIDHGNGLTTRYGHLHRQTVSVGQRVAAHTQIGFLGSTGRATGPHVHYEVLVNGEPHDPEKFLGLARLVPASARQ